MTDEELSQRAKQGDRDAQRQLYHRYADKVFRRCISMIRDEEKAKDMTHDIFIKIFTKMHTFKGKSAFSFWVYSISFNHCLSILRKEKKYAEKMQQFEDIEDYAAQIDEWEQLKELRLSQLEIILPKMNVMDQELLLMRYREGLTIKEMALLLHIGNSAVKMRLKRSRDRLARALKQLEDEKR